MPDEAGLRVKQIADVIRCGHLVQLAELAAARRGFGNSDVGFGVIYPDDLDPDEREREPIRDGCVRVYGDWGKAFEFDVAERAYLAVLAKALRENGMTKEAERVEGIGG